jgi:hypothetical protein
MITQTTPNCNWSFYFMWVSMFRDRNHLYKLIEDAVMRTEEEA